MTKFKHEVEFELVSVSKSKGQSLPYAAALTQELAEDESNLSFQVAVKLNGNSLFTISESAVVKDTDEPYAKALELFKAKHSL